MSKFTSPLNHVKVAAPCPASWDSMVGGERVRFCSQCNLNVYNLSGMSKKEAEALLVNREGRLCVRYYRRSDGSILTKNCPVGLRALAKRASKAAGALLSAILSFGAGVGLSYAVRFEQQELELERSEDVVMGDIAVTEEPTTFPPAVLEEPRTEMGQLVEITRADQPPMMGKIVLPVRHPKKTVKNHKR